MFRNLAVICQEEDGAYNCTIEIYDDWSSAWLAIRYVARRGDPAPANIWIIEQIETGAFAPVGPCPLPPEPTQPYGDIGPSVA